MMDIDTYLWETLYIVKQFHDHDKEKIILSEYGDCVLCGDYMYEMALDGISSAFSDTRCYYCEDEEAEVFVFFDPALDTFYQTCRIYEISEGIAPEENRHRSEVERAINSALSFNDYNYVVYLYDDLNRRGRCRIVLKLYCEFYCHYEVPGGLFEVLDVLKEHTKRMEQKMAEAPHGAKITLLPRKKLIEKEAA